MYTRTFTTVFFLAAFIITLGAPDFTLSQGIEFDILVRGGQIVDGTGSPAFEADIGIREDKIATIGDLNKATAGRIIDATGLVVAPGFIDVHNHTGRALADSTKHLNAGFLHQGVTTVIGGPDGLYSPTMIRLMLGAYKQQGIGTNVAFYIGHNGVRIMAMENIKPPLTEQKLRRAYNNRSSKNQQRTPTPDEMEQMKTLVREGMELGAIGLSTGLMYPPGIYSTTDEVVELARVVKPYGGIYTSHIRNPVKEWLVSNQEAIEIGERAGIPVKLTHLKAVGLENTPRMDSLISMVEQARARGVEVVSDQYPYDGAGTMTLKDLILVNKDPAINQQIVNNRDTLSAVLSDQEQRKKILENSEQGIDGGFSWIKTIGYSALRVTNSPDFPELEGQYLSEIAEDRKQVPFDLVSNLLLQAEQPVNIKGGIEESTIKQLLQQPWNMIASDGGYADAANNHPRSTGTFPRVLGHYVRKSSVLSLEEAVRKMTSFPAEFSGLSERGQITEGYYADITVFDPKTIKDRSTYTEPNTFGIGVHHVIVNGIPVILANELTRETPGRFLKRAE